MMKKNITISENIKNNHTSKQYHIVVFSAFCGMGKTDIVQQLSKKEKLEVLSLDTEKKLSIDEKSQVILIDNAHRINDEETQHEIVELIQKNEEKIFYILTRSEFPHWLLSFQLTGKSKVFYEPDFRLNQNEIKAFFEDYNIKEDELIEIHNETDGFPLYLNMLLLYLEEGNIFTESCLSIVKERMFQYITEQVFNQFSVKSRHILLCVSLFDEFDKEFIKMVSGEIEAQETINEIRSETNILLNKTSDIFTITPFFQEYLKWLLLKEYKEEEIRQLYSSAGRYYELNQQIDLALSCYEKSIEERKIIKILADNSDKNPAIGEYLEIEPYYLALSKEEIKKSPSLMSGMSMLKCMRANYEESTYWYKQLEEHLQTLKKTSKEYKSVKAKLTYLDIALPQFGTDNLLDVFTRIFDLLRNKEMALPQFSITSLLPSILNGGKDFSSWTKKDIVIYKTMRLPCEAVLGKDGIGSFDCAICESLFEKGLDYVPYLLQAMSKLTEIQQNGTNEIEFYLIGLMSRIQVFQGNSESGKEILTSLKKRFSTQNDQRFYLNIQAMLCKIDLLQGNYEKSLQWLEEDAPKDDYQIWTLLRLQYLVKCQVYIQQGNFLQALCLLSQLKSYTINCNRHIDKIQVNILIAICYYREKKQLWKENLIEALETAYEYSYVYPISQYGVAILPLLLDYKPKVKNLHFDKIVLFTRNQASIYQRYLEPISKVVVRLSPAELSVLRLICQNNSNAEIGRILDIKLPTVKAHTSNIFKKMNVSRRSEAKTEAKRLNLIDDYLAQ